MYKEVLLIMGWICVNQRNLTVRTHPKHNTQKVWASLATGNMGFLHIQLPQLVP